MSRSTKCCFTFRSSDRNYVHDYTVTTQKAVTFLMHATYPTHAVLLFNHSSTDVNDTYFFRFSNSNFLHSLLLRLSYVQVFSALLFRAVFWVILPCRMIVDNHFTRQYNPEDSSEHHTRRRENLKSHFLNTVQKSPHPPLE
jgi:hypothetical protein